MNWLEAHIDTNHAGLEDVTALLSSLGIDGVVIDDEEEFRDFLEENRQAWDYVDENLEKKMEGLSRLTFYLPDDEEGYGRLARVRLALQEFKTARKDCGSLLMTLENIQDADWENNWKKYYKPLLIGDRLMVVPRWEQTETLGRVPVILDPGLSFGTGNHASTRLCLEALEKAVRGGERVLDLGCGSGILSIAALRLGAERAEAVDIDRMCEKVARENAGFNGIGEDRFSVRIGNVLTDAELRAALGGGYQVVLANIVADVIIGLAPLVPGFLAPGGTFLCSGIIEGRQAEVMTALRGQGLVIDRVRSAEDWYALTCHLGA